MTTKAEHFASTVRWSTKLESALTLMSGALTEARQSGVPVKQIEEMIRIHKSIERMWDSSLGRILELKR